MASPIEGHPARWRSPARPARGRRAAALACAVTLTACTNTARYTPERDDAAVADIVGAYAGSGAALTLCEDVARADAAAAAVGDRGCVTEHVVRGGGRTVAHDVDHPWSVGCGGCPFGVIARVHGTVATPGAAPRAVIGSVQLQNGDSGDPYAFPYGLALTCDDPANPCALRGTLGAGGHLELSGLPGAASPVALIRTAAGGCP
jgi:hypothetical protein